MILFGTGGYQETFVSTTTLWQPLPYRLAEYSMLLCRYLLLCAYDSMDDHGRVTLHGLFNQINAVSFPVSQQPFAVALELTACEELWSTRALWFRWLLSMAVARRSSSSRQNHVVPASRQARVSAWLWTSGGLCSKSSATTVSDSSPTENRWPSVTCPSVGSAGRLRFSPRADESGALRPLCSPFVATHAPGSYEPRTVLRSGR
jgi:hypothetical protein